MFNTVLGVISLLVDW